MLTEERRCDIAALSGSRRSERDKCIGFPSNSRKTSAQSKHKLKKREALLLNSYNSRNVVNNSLSLGKSLTFYFGSVIPCPDILARGQCRVTWVNGGVAPPCGMLSSAGFTKIQRASQI
jgi:hypothetical protein